MYSLDNDVRKSLAESAVYCAAVIDKTRTMIGFKAGQNTAPVAFMQAVAASIANGDLGFRDEQAADRFFNTNKFLRAFSKSYTFEERLALAGLKLSLVKPDHDYLHDATGYTHDDNCRKCAGDDTPEAA